MPTTRRNATSTDAIRATEKLAFWEQYKYIVIGCMAAGLGLLVLIGFFVLFVVLKKRIASQSETAGMAEARTRIKEAESGFQEQMSTQAPQIMYLQLIANHPTMTKTDAFPSVVKSVSEMSGQTTKHYLTDVRHNRFAPPESDKEARRVMDLEMRKCDLTRFPDVEIFECTQAPVVGQHVPEKDHWCLHANILLDLYSKQFIISQAPTKNLFEYHWEVIWQRKIGVIVWLGPSGFTGKSITSYIATSAGHQVSHGRFDIRTTKAINYEGLYKVFTLGLRNRHIYTTVDLKGRETRELFLIHIENWPATQKKADSKTLALLVEMVRSLEWQQLKSRDLGGIWTHCTTGMEQSAAFFAMYVSRQMHFRFKVVNVKGVLKIIERTRYKSLHAPEAFDQIQIVHAVVAEFVKSFPCGNEEPANQTTAVKEATRIKLALTKGSSKKSTGSDQESVIRPKLVCAIPKKEPAASKVVKSVIGGGAAAKSATKSAAKSVIGGGVAKASVIGGGVAKASVIGGGAR